ncbi:hypothetical protein ACIHCQ_35525 [Streptomyces sp. NPDC052236]|uniref:hypothetical protein n=1 Tax=Streptomyces sp. NPDC052236 TaxID=3365686 RepID=UPI0037D8656E
MAADISEYIGDIAGSILPSPFNKIVEAFCKIKAALIKAVSAGYGCRHSSNPALAVYNGKLYCVHCGNNDASMWCTTFDGTRWSRAIRIPDAATVAGPALAVFKGKLSCVHRGNSDQSLWWMTFDGSRWSQDTEFSRHGSGAGPALIVYRDPYGTEDQLMCVHRGFGTKSAPTETDGVLEPAAVEGTSGESATS